MLVREEQRIDFERVHAAQRQSGDDLSGAQPSIDQQPALWRLDQGAVARATAAENGDEKHSSH
jgi:hypothetical protein